LGIGSIRQWVFWPKTRKKFGKEGKNLGVGEKYEINYANKMQIL